jgi:predicted small secreted protein
MLCEFQRWAALSVLAAFTAAGMAACNTVSDTGGDVVVPARSEALGNLNYSASGGTGMPTNIRYGVCNETNISECGESLQKIAREGRLVFRYPDGSLRRYAPR